MVPDNTESKTVSVIRVSASTGDQRLMSNVAIGPGSGFLSCLPNEALRAVVHGVRFQRLAFHPFLFPSGQGPGFHHTDSATGTIELVLRGERGTRALLKERVFNSDRILELLSDVCVDPGGHWAAMPVPATDRWRLVIFRR